jgi:hypothetical protein
MPGLRNWVRKYVIFMAIRSETLIVVYFIMLSSLIGFIPSLEPFKKMKITKMKIALMTAIQQRLKYHLLFNINNGDPLPE